MSLNKFVSDTPIKDWLNVGANSVRTYSLDTSEIKVDGIEIQPVCLKFSSRGSPLTGSIFPGPTVFVTHMSAGIGDMEFTTPFKAGKELRIVTLGQINSTSASNVITYRITDNGTLVSSGNLSSTGWQPFDSVRFETIYVFTSSTSAQCFSYYTKNNGQMINYSIGSVTFQNVMNNFMEVGLTATGACDFSHYQTTVYYS